MYGWLTMLFEPRQSLVSACNLLSTFFRDGKLVQQQGHLYPFTTTTSSSTSAGTMMMPQVDWLSWAARFNQASLLPFLAFLWTISVIPDMPKKALRGWYLYIVFIAVAIPAGIYSKTHLGTSLANIDWLHGPCEALLTTANLFIVLGLRDAIRAATTTGSTAAATAGSTTAEASGSNTKMLQADAAKDAMDDMQYMQQLHDVYSSEHGTGEAAAAAAGGTTAPMKAEVVSHLKGFEATAAEKARKLYVVESAASPLAPQDPVALGHKGHAEGTNSSAAVAAAASSHNPADTPHADKDPLSNMHYMQQLHAVYGSQHRTEAANEAGLPAAAGRGKGHIAANSGHLQGFSAAETRVDDVNMTGNALADMTDMSSQHAGSGPAVHAVPRRAGGAQQHSKLWRVPGAVQRPNMLYRAGCFKTPARGLRALTMA